MVRRVPGCMGHFDFEKIAEFARKRFVEGIDTVSLMSQAESQQEKEEIALVSLLDVDNHQIRDLRLSCPYDRKCRIMSCRKRLRKMIARNLATH